MNNLFMTRRLSIPEKYAQEVSNNIISINVHRNRILSHILITVNIILFLLDTLTYEVLRWNQPIFIRFSKIHLLMILTALIYLILTNIHNKYKKHNSINLKVIYLSLNVLVLLFSSLIGIRNILNQQQPYAYIIALFCISPLIFLTPLERILVFVIPYVVYNINAIINIHNNTSFLISIIFFSTLINALALFVSNIIYSSFITIFISNNTIIDQNKKLENLYENTEKILRIRTEELNETLENEKLRTAFFANISHEFRTPLNVVFSAEQIIRYKITNIKDYENKKEISKYVDMIKQNCYRLVRLIDNLIDSTKLDAGYFLCSLKNWNIVNVVEDICLSVAKYIENRDIKLTFDTEIEEKMIACDADMVERIMLNLISNAVKFTPKGGSIFVNISEHEDKITISVKDTGIGIPDNMKDSIFEKFIQVDKTTNRKTEGSGIGLSIVKSLCEIQNGSISVISEEGKGSEFVFELPNRMIDDTQIKRDETEETNQLIEKINIEFSDIYY